MHQRELVQLHQLIACTQTYLGINPDDEEFDTYNDLPAGPYDLTPGQATAEQQEEAILALVRGMDACIESDRVGTVEYEVTGERAEVARIAD